MSFADRLWRRPPFRFELAQVFNSGFITSRDFHEDWSNTPKSYATIAFSFSSRWPAVKCNVKTSPGKLAAAAHPVCC